MSRYLFDFREINESKPDLVGGKGWNLGQLFGIEGINVPDGFCITTEAYRTAIKHNEELTALVSQLAILKAEDRTQISQISARIRSVIEGSKIAKEIESEIVLHLDALGANNAYAVRSSATAEDLPYASFAGQQDTYLNVKGQEAILQSVKKCWASLFTDRAVIYRLRNGFDHRQVYLSVIIQRMVFPEASGVMFTADPATSNRKVLSINACFGLGEALVSGLVNADLFMVRDGRISDKVVAHKKLGIYALREGGTETRGIEPEQQHVQTLTDEQVLQLEQIGRKIEAYFACPQDIEWCMVWGHSSEGGVSPFLDGKFYIVQSRPITTLFPLPEVSDGKNHVFVSFSHMQMMTDAIKPLGLSFWRFIGDPPMPQAGGRIFLDASAMLSLVMGRKAMVSLVSLGDILMENALSKVIQRKDYLKTLPRKLPGSKRFAIVKGALPVLFQTVKISRANDAALVPKLIERIDARTRGLQEKIAGVSGDELFDLIMQEKKEFQEVQFDPASNGAIAVGSQALKWLNKNMAKWLGDVKGGDALSQSVPYNITSEMGLALLDVADVVRLYPAVIAYLEQADDNTFFEGFDGLPGGGAVRDSIQAFLEQYGMRCPGEIDITRPRWSEQPTALVPAILSNVRNLKPGAHKTRVEQGRLEAEQKERDLLARLERLPGGKRKARKTRRTISILHNFIGYREYPKYFWIRRWQIYKEALMKEADVLMQKGVIQDREDVYYLSLEEFRDAVRSGHLDYSVIAARKEEHAAFEKMTPPRVLTSEGEVISGEYGAVDIPPEALVGVPASSGVIEGPARIVLRMEDASLDDGDILVTTFTDPSWTPLFLSVRGLVTEVGGSMTHGATIAREYGLPAVVGVENATRLIEDGRRIRVHGTLGYVEIL
ncbi:MAG TPA: phosphoenolpyruvate synthase [Syntrophomonadaceae bacterium]|nr:phosphoenolpyruvate synthase [Syntrophomonadaceae bacterium]